MNEYMMQLIHVYTLTVYVPVADKSWEVQWIHIE